MTENQGALQTSAKPVVRYFFFALILGVIGVAAFAAGFAWSELSVGTAKADDDSQGPAGSPSGGGGEKSPRVVYPKKTELDFEGLAIEGEMRNPGEFYFQHRDEEKFDSLVKRRKNFHRDMLRDAMMGDDGYRHR